MTKAFFEHKYKQFGGSTSNVSIPQTLRVNTLKISDEELITRLTKKGVTLKKISYLPHGYEVVKSPFSLGATPEYLLGYYYLQSAAAQLAIIVLNPSKNSFVLDCCASPGGKTTQLAQHMHNNGIIIALEKREKRIMRLKNNLERMNVQNTIAYHMDACTVSDLGISFDYALVDVPCSGNYTSDKDWFVKREPEDCKELAKTQLAILIASWNALKKGGVLVYSTCSLEPEENEIVIDTFLKNNKDAIIEDTNTTIGDGGITTFEGVILHKDISKCKRFWPHKTNTEGFFIARIKKL